MEPFIAVIGSFGLTIPCLRESAILPEFRPFGYLPGAGQPADPVRLRGESASGQHKTDSA